MFGPGGAHRSTCHRPAHRSGAFASRREGPPGRARARDDAQAGAANGASPFATLFAGSPALTFGLSGADLESGSEVVVGVPSDGPGGHAPTPPPFGCRSTLRRRWRRCWRCRQWRCSTPMNTSRAPRLAAEQTGDSARPIYRWSRCTNRLADSPGATFRALGASARANPRAFENFVSSPPRRPAARDRARGQYNTDLFDAETVQRWPRPLPPRGAGARPWRSRPRRSGNSSARRVLDCERLSRPSTRPRCPIRRPARGAGVMQVAPRLTRWLSRGDKAAQAPRAGAARRRGGAALAERRRRRAAGRHFPRAMSAMVAACWASCVTGAAYVPLDPPSRKSGSSTWPRTPRLPAWSPTARTAGARPLPDAVRRRTRAAPADRPCEAARRCSRLRDLHLGQPASPRACTCRSARVELRQHGGERACGSTAWSR